MRKQSIELRTSAVQDGNDDAEHPPRRECYQERVVRFIFGWVPPKREYTKQDLSNRVCDKRAQEAELVVVRGQKLHLMPNEVVKKSSHMPRYRDFEGGQTLPSSEIVVYTSF
jgi:hypothetical protein